MKRKSRKYYRLNFRISAPELRVVDEKGRQVGVFTREEALRRAKEKGVDLVEVAPNAKPPVCRLMDFKKFRYLEAKKEKERKKKTKEVEQKELKLTPFMGDHDLRVRVKKARELLEDGHRLKIWVQFRGRQFTKKEYGYEILKKLAEEVGDISKLEQRPKMVGRKLVSLLVPVKNKAGKNGKEKKTENKNSG